MIAPKLPDHLLTVYRIDGVNALILMLTVFDIGDRCAYECPGCGGKGGNEFDRITWIACGLCERTGKVALDEHKGLVPFE